MFKNFSNYEKKFWLLIIGILFFIVSTYILNRNAFNNIGILLLIFSLFIILIFFYFYSKKVNSEIYIFYYRYNKYLFLTISATILFLFAIFAYIKNWHNVFYLLSICSYICLFSLMKKINVICTAGSELLKKEKVKNLSIKFSIVLILVIFSIFAFKKYNLFYFLLLIFFMAFIFGSIFNKKNFIDEEKIYKEEILFLFFLFAIAIFLRIIKFADIPPGFTYDVRRAFDIINQIASGKSIGVFIGDIDVSSASLIFYEMYYFLKIFGFDMLNMRIFMVLHSIISIPIFFFLVKELYDKKIAIFSTIIFSLSFIFILYSRLDNGLYLAIFYLVLGLYFLIKGIKKGNIAYIVIAGIFTAFNMYTYHSAKVHILIAILIFFIYCFEITRIKKTYKNLIVLFIFLLSFLIFFFPLLYFIITQFNIFTQRATGISPTGISKELFITFYHNFKDIFYSFIVKGSNYEYVNLPFRPIFTGLEAFLFILGIGYLLYGWKSKNNLVILVWLVVSMLPEIYFSHHSNPYYFRMILIFPALAIVAGLGANVIYKSFEELFNCGSKYIYFIVIIILTINSIYVTKNDYFEKYAKDPIMKEQFDYVNREIEKFVLKNSNENKIFISQFYFNNRSMFCMQCYKSLIKPEIKDIFTIRLNELQKINTNVIFLVEGIFDGYFDYLKEFFPNLIIEKIKNEENLKFWIDPVFPEYLFLAIKISRDDIINAQGLIANYYSDNKIIKSEKIYNEFLPVNCGRIELTGSFELTDTDKYEFNIEDADFEVIVDNKKYTGYKLTKGLHSLKIILQKFSLDKKLNITIKNSKNELLQNIFFTNNKIFGIDAIYKAELSGNKLKKRENNIIKRINWFNPDINFIPGEGEFNVTWNGYYYAEKEGEYDFYLFSPKEFCNIIQVGNNEIFTIAGEKKDKKEIHLKKGWHKIRVKSYASIIQSVSGSYFKLKVKEPDDKEFKTIEYYKLKPFK